MFLRKRKQGGFISAELGIGILVISLLTIMGFLAAADLDDEISRSPKIEDMKPTTPISTDVVNIIKGLQGGINSGTYSSMYEDMKMENRFAYRLVSKLYSMYSQPLSFFSSTGDSVSNTTQPGDRENAEFRHITWVDSRHDHGYVEIKLYPNNTITMITHLASDYCSEYLPGLKKDIPLMFHNVECTGSKISVRKTLTENTDFLGVLDEDSSLDGTWMGDL